MRGGWRALAVLLILVVTAGTSFAAGFRLPEAGAKAMGMAFAFTAQADDPSAIYFNPAGLTQLQGQNVMLGATYIRENGAEFNGSTPLTGGAVINETQKSLNFVVPNAYYTYTTKDGWYSFGVGIFTPFGLGQEYESNSFFRNQVTKIELQTLVFNPTIAFKINEYLSVGVGVDYMWGNVKYNKSPILPPQLGGGTFQTELEGDGQAWGWNFGLLFKPTENLKVGFNYRSPFNLKVSDADFTAGNPQGTVPLPMGTTSASGTLKMPATATLGAAYTYGRLTVEVDGDWTFWHSYSDLTITNNDFPAYSSTALKKWKDVCAFRMGAEYRVTDPLALRLGFSYDPTPAPDATLGPELPDATRMNYNVGVGYKIGKVTIDAAFMYIDRFDRTVNNLSPAGTGMNGTWKGDAWLAGLDVAYKF
ncbi:MAG: OmpP1/FadL family transporter [Verrucomicrobiota bacterium]